LVKEFYFSVESIGEHDAKEIMVDLDDDGYLEAYFSSLKGKINTKDMKQELNNYLSSCKKTYCEIPIVVSGQYGEILFSDLHLKYFEKEDIFPKNDKVKVNSSLEKEIAEKGWANVLIFANTNSSKDNLLDGLKQSYFGIQPFDIIIKKDYSNFPAINAVITSVGFEKLIEKKTLASLRKNGIVYVKEENVNISLNKSGVPCIIGRGKGIGKAIARICFSSEGNCPGGVKGATFTSKKVKLTKEKMPSPSIVVQITNKKSQAYLSDIYAALDYCLSDEKTSYIMIDKAFYDAVYETKTASQNVVLIQNSPIKIDYLIPEKTTTLGALGNDVYLLLQGDLTKPKEITVKTILLTQQAFTPLIPPAQKSIDTAFDVSLPYVKNKLFGAKSSVESGIDASANSLMDGANNAGGLVKNAFNSTINFIKNSFAAIGDLFVKIWNNLVVFFSDSINFIKNTSKTIYSFSVAILESTYENFSKGVYSGVVFLFDNYDYFFSVSLDLVNALVPFFSVLVILALVVLGILQIKKSGIFEELAERKRQAKMKSQAGDLYQFIHKSVEQGKKPQQIKSLLVKSGWPKDYVEQSYKKFEELHKGELKR